MRVFVGSDDNIVKLRHAWAQAVHQKNLAIGLAIHGCIHFATAAVQKASPSQSSHISNVSTKNTLCYSTSVHAQYYQPHAHAGTDLASFLNKIRQT